MEELAAITRELDSLERVQAELRALASRDDDQRRNDLVVLRRNLSAQIAQVGRVAEPVFGTLADAATVQDYRGLFSKMRSATALHQANWPAVMLGERHEEYRASALAVHEVHRTFLAWMRDAIDRFKREGSTRK